MTQLNPETGLKVCPLCVDRFPEGKPASEFGHLARSADNLYFYCRECHITSHADWRRVNPEVMMLNGARRRAKSAGISFSLVRGDIHIPETCPVNGCGRSLVVSARNGGGLDGQSSSPSLDRYDPSQGYVPENVWVICNWCNSRKQNMSGEDHVTFGLQLIDSFKRERERLRPSDAA